ncbi:unnamed protein product, partial [marine sediment metagenome]
EVLKLAEYYTQTSKFNDLELSEKNDINTIIFKAKLLIKNK